MDQSKIKLWIDQEANTTSRAYGAWTSFPDVVNALWVWALSNEERINEYFGREDGDRIVRSIIRTEARNYAVRERASVSGYEYDDVAWYTVTAIKRILPDVFDYEDWQTFESRSGGSSGKPAAWSGDKLATLIDVSKAVATLKADDRILLREHYANGISMEGCALILNIEYEAARKRLQRALKALSRALNDPRPLDPMEGVTYEEWKRNQHFYDTRGKFRKSMSNAAARKATEI